VVIFCEKIRDLREARDWSQARLAKEARISQATIADIELGNQRSTRALPRIAMALGVEVSDLDPDFPLPIKALNPELAGLAFEAMLQALFPEEFSDKERQGLARVFLDLAQARPLDTIDVSPHIQMRLRLELLVKPWRKK
jgi:transcriptional regulator with XRE-family HTH domain